MSDHPWQLDPYAPQYATPMGVAQPSFPYERMVRLGATADLLDRYIAFWNELTEDQQAEAAGATAVLTDAELAEQIASDLADPEGSSFDAEVPSGTANEIMVWVAGDPSRARQAEAVERGGLNRSGLLARLERIT